MTSFSLPATGAKTAVTLANKFPKEYDALIVPVSAGADGVELAATGFLDDAAETAIQQGLAAVGATGKPEEVNRIPAPAGVAADFVVSVGLGPSDKITSTGLRRASGVVARSLAGVDTAVFVLDDVDVQAVVEGALLGAYKYTGLKSQSDPAPVADIVVLVDKSAAKAAKVTVEQASIIAESVNLTRDLINAPSSHLYPESYAAVIAEIAKEYGLDVNIRDEKQLAKQGFGGILAVGLGSERKPRLVQLRYRPRKAKKHVSLVGKGITFDTGGISIKPSAQMDNMISDMGGSAAVIATIVAASRLKLNVAVTATVSLAENMPDGAAYRPGDVITHYGGTTTEILNTDAEGRLVLADALVLASEDKPDYLIDTATLTGAQIMALGNRTSGVMGAEDFAAELASIGRSVDENAWAMPLPEELAESMKSPVADLRNVNGIRSAGSMLAAGCFLREFVGEGITWAHVDIAGPSYNTNSPHGFTPARGTGVPVRTFVQFLSNLSA